MTSDWHWAPYNTIAGEIGRSIATFEFFTKDRKFNAADFADKVNGLLADQESLVIILNTPAHNPTGYSLTLEGLGQRVVSILTDAAGCGKAIALVVDAAYIDFAGDEEECRRFLPKLAELPANVLLDHGVQPFQDIYALRYEMRRDDLHGDVRKEIADELRRVCEYSSRGSWSNSARVGQVILSRIYGDPELLADVDAERAHYRDMLAARGKAFTEAAGEAGLDIVPFDAGFFVSIPCDDPDAVSAELEKEGVFIVPLAKACVYRLHPYQRKSAADFRP